MKTQGKTWSRVLLAALVIAAVGGGFWARKRVEMRKDAPPELETPNYDPATRSAGSCFKHRGSTFARISTPDDFQSPKASPHPAVADATWTQFAQGSTFLIGTLFNVGPQGVARLSTAGKWMVSLEGEGEFVFEDARRSDDSKVATDYWFVKKGTFRAKPHEFDRNDHWMQIRTAVATIYLHNGEIGMRINEGGTGQVWLTAGKATVIRADGTKRELPLKGMDYL